MSELNDIKVPSAGEPEWRGEITDGKLDQILGGLLIPNQGFSKAMAREIKELRVREAAHKAELERDLLRERCERLSAPVSDEEMQKFALHWMKLGTLNQINDHPVLTSTQVNALIAARREARP